MKVLACMLGATLALTACAEIQGARPVTVEGQPADYRMSEVPEGLQAIAAPYQDLTEVRINDADGCYVYRYAGPVETTFLPLRTREGRPICTRSPEV
ncbi:hypothetical protein ACFE33_15435 (plasmid) [Falsihalocynthiibacter sp. SS001]|uniref:hypothetical protein n=1 Tax=Falsihalocynthiibacter sp. SS001 TaxID=3349698 RepID=UPI0036D2A439